MRTYIKDINNKIDEKITVNGFVHAVRDQGGIIFLIIRDVTGLCQVVIHKKNKKVFELASELSLESVLEIEGKVKSEKQAPNGVELAADEIKILSAAEPGLPIPVVVEKGGEETDVTKRFDWRWIDLRKQEKLQIFKVWTALEKGFRKHVEENDYVQTYPPALMSTASESGSQVFKVDYFEKEAFLAQSPQFYKQLAMAAGFEKVFMVGPVFRAEPSFTTRHMTEFTGWDFEISYIKDHNDVMDELEKFIVAGFEQVKKDLSLDIEVPGTPFPKVTMEEAKKLLGKKGIESKTDYDLSPEEERELGNIIKEDKGHDFVFLTDWPIEGRPFYHMRYEDNPKLTKSYDLLYKGIELVTGSQREHRVDVLREQAKDMNMPLEELEHYFNFFKYGCPPHGGGGIGPSRIVMMMLDLPSVKEATFLPRDVKRLTP